MSSCCEAPKAFDGLSRAYKRTLWVVVAINAIMFGVEMTAGVVAQSQALKADALDFFADSATYAISLAVIGAPLAWRARAALFKGLSLAAMGLWVLGSTVYNLLILELPHAETMGIVGFLALAANLLSVGLLLRYRNGDANVRSVWLCSRNDAIGNVAVIVAASGVWATATAWPDLVVATAMASLFLWSSGRILQLSLGELRQARLDAAATPATTL